MPNTKTVLVVDDEEDIRRSVSRLLAGQGYEILTASDGNEALNIVRELGWVDLIVLDVMMPKLDGYEVLYQLRLHGFRDIRVILLTAKSETHDIVHGYNRGAGLYISKPFDPAVLMKAVDYMLGEHSPEERDLLEMDLLSAIEVYLCIPGSPEL